MRRFFRVIISTVLILILSFSLVEISSSQEKLQEIKIYNSPAEYEKVTKKKIARYNEAPMLAELVKAGKLPPVAERLPKNPIVVEPLEEIGQYGGTWYMAVTGKHYALNSMIDGRIGDMGFVKFNETGSKLLPNWADRWEVSKDAKVYTLHIREGLKWSDGAPFTTEDIMFWIEDVYGNKELTPTYPSWLMMGGERIKVEVIDKYTVKFHLPQKNALFMYALFGNFFRFAPKHYMKQFHPKYTPMEELQKKVKAEGLDNWWTLFGNKAYVENPECPGLRAFKIVSVSPSRVVAERNPYYWKIDTAGNQLPYIDRVVIDIVSSEEVVQMKAMNGELSMQTFHLPLTSYPILKENESKGGYRVLLWPSATAEAVLYPNHNYKEDPVIGALLRNPTFKKALSMAIDREAINKVVTLGLAVATQLSPPKGDALYNKDIANAYSQYDPQKASELLDSIGLSKKDKDGFRLRPDGKLLTLTIIGRLDWPIHKDVCEMVKKYWEDIGIKTNVELLSFELSGQRISAGLHQIGIWKTDDPLTFPIYLKPYAGILWPFGMSSWMAPLWDMWVSTGGKQGERPPKEYLEVKSYVERAVSAPNERERIALGKKIWENFVKNLWSIGILQQRPVPIVVKNNFKNVPSQVLEGWGFRTPSNSEIGQFFIKGGK
ncbi:ABC transporter substrate-binding protein [bacterium]|nr:ABC transporter substrate-binding protein [bacterium]